MPRSRKRGRRAPGPSAGGEAVTPDPGGGAAPARRARGEERNAEVRAGLEPLREGERPGAVTVAAIVAAALAVANLGLFLAGVKVRGQNTQAGGVILFAALMLVAAGGMWRARYWAVLGFEALLGISLVISALSLVRASNLLGVLVPVTVLSLGGWLFWKLVRAMARIQMPERTPGGGR